MRIKKLLPTILALSMTVGLTACKTAETNVQVSPEETDATTEAINTMDCDIVVVGAGNSGLVTAVAAADGGASVIVVEKLGIIGGSAVASSGMYMTVNSTYAETNAPDVDDSMEYALPFVMGIHDLSTVKNLDEDKMQYALGKTGETIDYLASLGMTAETSMWVESYGQWPCTQWEGKGSGLISQLSGIAEQQGTQILTDCPATELLLDDQGEVAGVICTYQDEVLQINAKKVVLATGGFAQNEEMIETYVNDWTPMETFNRASVGNTGDGITMALSVGADLYDNWMLMASASPATVSLSSAYKSALTGSFDRYSEMSFNANGVRYTNENPSMALLAANDMLSDPSDAYYYLVDGTMEEYKTDLEIGMELGEVVFAESIEELADMLDIDAKTLSASYEEYQEYCSSGVDETFGKDTEHLVAYKGSEGFYAVRYYPMIIGSFGGVVTDYDAHVLAEDGSIIPNLFAVGEMSNRTFFNQIYVGGTSLGFGAVMGRAAAAAAVAEIQ